MMFLSLEKRMSLHKRATLLQRKVTKKLHQRDVTKMLPLILQKRELLHQPDVTNMLRHRVVTKMLRRSVTKMLRHRGVTKMLPPLYRAARGDWTSDIPYTSPVHST